MLPTPAGRARGPCWRSGRRRCERGGLWRVCAWGAALGGQTAAACMAADAPRPARAERRAPGSKRNSKRTLPLREGMAVALEVAARSHGRRFARHSTTAPPTPPLPALLHKALPQTIKLSPVILTDHLVQCRAAHSSNATACNAASYCIPNPAAALAPHKSLTRLLVACCCRRAAHI